MLQILLLGGVVFLSLVQLLWGAAAAATFINGYHYEGTQKARNSAATGILFLVAASAATYYLMGLCLGQTFVADGYAWLSGMSWQLFLKIS